MKNSIYLFLLAIVACACPECPEYLGNGSESTYDDCDSINVHGVIIHDTTYAHHIIYDTIYRTISYDDKK